MVTPLQPRPMPGGTPMPRVSSPYRMPHWPAIGVPIWVVLGLTREYWEMALKNEHYFTETYLDHRAEVDSPKCEAALRKVWGDAFEENARKTRRYLTAVAPSFFRACDDEGHMFAFMPNFWEAAFAAARGDAA